MLLLNIFKLIRIQNIIFLGIALSLGRVFLVGNQNWAFLVDLNFVFFCLGAMLVMGGGYAINSYYDIKIDNLNHKENVIADQNMQRRQVIIVHAFLYLSGISLGFLGGITSGMIIFCSAFFLWLYSNQLQRLHIFGNLTIGFLAAWVVLSLGFWTNNWNITLFFYAFFGFIIGFVRAVLKDCASVRGDEYFSNKTLPIRLGIRKTKIVIYSLTVFGSSVSLFLVEGFGSKNLLALFVLTLIFIAYFLKKLYVAFLPAHFNFLVSFCKWLMLLGVLLIGLV